MSDDIQKPPTDLTNDWSTTLQEMQSEWRHPLDPLVTQTSSDPIEPAPEAVTEPVETGETADTGTTEVIDTSVDTSANDTVELAPLVEPATAETVETVASTETGETADAGTPEVIDASVDTSADTSANDTVELVPQVEPAVAQNTENAPVAIALAEPLTEPTSAPNTSIDDLEETTFPTSGDEVSFSAGEVLAWGDHRYTIQSPLAGSWYSAQNENGQAVLLNPNPLSDWKNLPSHRLLPRPRYIGKEGYVLDDVQGSAYAGPMSTQDILPLLTALAQYVFVLSKQGYALLDLAPEGIVKTNDGLRLRFPPRISPVAQPLPRIYREGYTAPELTYDSVCNGKEGVYVLGAIGYQWLSGQTLPPEGATHLALSAIQVAGWPQLLYAALTHTYDRININQFLDRLTALQPREEAQFRVGAASTVGLNVERPTNEDSYAFAWQQVHNYQGRTVQLLACVSDGMGGMSAGEVASRAAVQAFIRQSLPDFSEQAMDTLAWECNQAVLDALEGRDGGCTLSGVVLSGANVLLAHIGDSRIYQRKQDGWQQLSDDHSLVAAMVKSGILTPEQAATSPDRNKILRSLGSLRQYQSKYAQTAQHRIQVDEVLLLVSDGVWGEVSDAEIEQLWQSTLQPQAFADALIAAALAAGAPDNASAVVIERLG